MRNRYKIPEIRAVQLLGCMTEEAFTKQLPEFNTADASREVFMKWTMQDECPMFHLAESILRERADGVNPAFREDDLSRVFVYMDFAGIFDRPPTGKIAELQKKAELMFHPEGIPLMIDWKPARYIAFERSASMSRNSKLCFVRENMYGELRKRMMLDMTIGHCQLSKLYAYNGLLFTGGRRIDSRSLLNERRIIVVDNPKTIIPEVKTITVDDNGTKKAVRTYARVEKNMDIEITEFDGEGLISPRLAQQLEPENAMEHLHHSFQIRLPYIKGVVHEVDFASLFQELEVHMIQDIWGNWHSADDVDLILTRSMFKGFGWMTENGISWSEYLRRCLQYDHALYVSGMDSTEEQSLTELNYQFLNTAHISGEEFRPQDLPDSWNHTPDWDNRTWLTKATERAYWDYLGNNVFQRQYFLSRMDDPAYRYRSDDVIRGQLLEKNRFFIEEPIFQRELRDKAAGILRKYQNANLLVAGDNRYLSDDLMRLLAVIAQPSSSYAYRVLMSETMEGVVFYAPKPAYPPNDMFTLLRNPHIARNEEVIAVPFISGRLREKYLGHLHYVVMVDSRSLIPERLGGADYDGDMIKTISDPLMNRCVARNYGENYENAGNLPLLKIPAAEPILADAQDWKARFETVKATFSSRVGQISNAALRRSIIAYDENSTAEEREQCRRETETLAILTGLEIDSAKSGVKPDLSPYLGSNRGNKSLFLRFRSLSQRTEDRKWYEPTRKKQMEQFFSSVDWDSISSNLEKLPYYAYLLEKYLQELPVKGFTDISLFAFASDPDWKERLDPGLLKRMGEFIADYEEAQRRMRFLFIEPKSMTRQTDVQRILYANNLEDEYTVDELYHAFDLIPRKTIRELRRRLTEERWMFTPASERMAILERFELPGQTIPYWELFCDFRSGGYRILGDILCDFDDMHRGKETRKHIRTRSGDSDNLKYLMDGLLLQSDHRQELIRRCQNRLELFIATERVHPHELVKYAEALGKRDFALTIMPGSVLATALDRRGLFDEPVKKKKKRRWFWRV